MAALIQDSQFVSFFIYNPTLGPKEGTEHQKLLYYRPEEETLNRKVRNIGLCEALVNFTRTFSPDKPCEAVHTQRLRQVFFEPETNIWMVLTVSVPWVEVVNNGERSFEYHDSHVKDTVMQATLQRSYSMFKLFNGSFANITKQFGVEGLRRRLEKFFSRYLVTVEVGKLDIFSIFQGIQFLPLDKYMYLKVHCFVNLVETTFRNIQRTVLVYGDQLVWSGLEQEDIKIFYQYLLSWLFPSHFGSDFLSNISTLAQGGPPSVAPSNQPHTGSFLIGHSGTTSSSAEGGKSPWVYILVDGILQSCRLFVYNAGSATMCFFVQCDQAAPMEEFCKRLGTFLAPRLSQIARDIVEFCSKTRQPQVEQQYRFVYFNEMNLAVKSPLLSRKPPYFGITKEMMLLLTEINEEYDRLDEGETIMRTLADFWVVCRKSGHRRFFIILTQKSANFAEITEEVRRLCQREFTNIFFLD